MKLMGKMKVISQQRKPSAKTGNMYVVINLMDENTQEVCSILDKQSNFFQFGDIIDCVFDYNTRFNSITLIEANKSKSPDIGKDKF